MSLPRGQAASVLAAGRLTGRWRYERTVGRGIALSYDGRASRPPPARLSDVHAGGRLTGRWRFNRIFGGGIALSYDRSVSRPPAPSPAHPEPRAPVPTHSPMMRVLCSCGDDFTFDGDEGICPSCGRPASWPTMGVIEREMRSDLEDLLRDHKHGDDRY